MISHLVKGHPQRGSQHLILCVQLEIMSIQKELKMYQELLNFEATLLHVNYQLCFYFFATEQHRLSLMNYVEPCE